MQRSFLLMTTASLLFSISTTAQLSKGSRMAGASVGNIFINSGTSEQTITSVGGISVKTTGYHVNLTPSFGWFLTERTAAGFSFILNPTSEKNTFEENGSTFQKDKSTHFNIGGGGFVRHYFLNTGAFLPFGQFSFDAGIAKNKTDGFLYGGSGSTLYKDTYTGKSSGGFFSNGTLTAGITKMVGKYTGLDLYAGYNFYYTKSTMNITRDRDYGIDGVIDETSPKETMTKFTNHSFILGLGFQVFLEKR